MRAIDLSTVENLARDVGLIFLGAHDVGSLANNLEPHARRLTAWQQQGFHGDMTFMGRPASLLSDPRNTLTTARSAFFFAAHYNPTARPALQGDGFYGKIARYAWGEDYHDVIRAKLLNVWGQVALRYNIVDQRTRVFTDAVPILERGAVAELSAGFFGKNSLLIRRSEGSYFFIAEIITEAQFIPDDSVGVRTRLLIPRERQHPGAECGSCTACLSSCPTNAIREAGVIDARRCISYLTIEKRTLLSTEEMKQVGNWIFGCDVCQEVCPFNSTVSPIGCPEFGTSTNSAIELRHVLTMVQSDFDNVYGKSALRRAGLVRLQRNAIAIAANQNAFPILDVLLSIPGLNRTPLLEQQLFLALQTMLPRAQDSERSRIQRFLNQHRSDMESVEE